MIYSQKLQGRYSLKDYITRRIQVSQRRRSHFQHLMWITHRSTWILKLEKLSQRELFLSCSRLRFLKQLRTFVACAQVKARKACHTKGIFSIGLSRVSWCKVETSPTRMVPGVCPFMVLSSLMKSFGSPIHTLDFFRWPTQVQTLMDPNSSWHSNQFHGLMESTRFSVEF